MFFFNGTFDTNGKRFNLNGAYCNLIISNDDATNTLYVYDKENLIAILYAGETLEFRGYSAIELVIKTNTATASGRLWAW